MSSGVLVTDFDGVSGFFDEIYGFAGAASRLWTTGFASSGSGENWRGGLGLDWLRRRGLAPLASDLYFCIGEMLPGSSRRSNANVCAQHLLIVDDIGTKVSFASWDALFGLGFPLPTAQIETSPGNQTWIWALDGEAAGAVRAADLALIRAHILDQKLSDEVLDPARYIRMPMGHNSKPKYGPGVPPSVTLVEWRPPSVFGRVDLDLMGQALCGGVAGWRALPWPKSAAAAALMPSAVVGGLVALGAWDRRADLAAPEPIMLLGVELGMDLVQSGPGVVGALCPNIEAHTARAETGFAFLGDGVMKCQHAHCQGLSTPDFRAMMMDQYDLQQGAAIALGVLPVGAARDAHEFLARAAFGAGAAAAAADIAADVSRLVGAAVVRIANEADDLAGLVARFVWVNTVASFFDVVNRVLVPGDLFDTHPSVLRLFPVGSAGAKRAKNVILNSPDLRHADGVTVEPGNTSALVSARDQNGVVCQMANMWVGSARGLVRLAGLPAAWLDLVTWVIPDVGFRDWFLDWLAYLVQNPQRRLMTIPLIVGGQGIGKDMMLGPIIQILGRHNVKHVSTNVLAGQFTGWMLSSLVVLPELKLSADGRMYNQIKDWLSNAEDWVSINEKFARPYTTRATFSFCALTNHVDALVGIEADDRRWQVYISQATQNTPAWYGSVVAALASDDELARVNDFLLSRDLGARGFTPFASAPGGAIAKRAMQADTLAGAAQWTFQQTQAGGLFADRAMLTLAEVEAAALAVGNRVVSGAVSTKALRAGLEAAGWQSHGQVRAGQDRFRLWLDPEKVPDHGSLPAKVVAANYLAERDAHHKTIQAGLLSN